MAHIFALNRSEGGVPKLGVHEALITPDGMEGDAQKQTHVHGGPDKALCLFSLEVMLKLQEEGHPIFPGSTGENITITGLNWSQLKPGSRLKLGADTEVEITDYTTPCNTIEESFHDRRFVRISKKLHLGQTRLYARVIQAGKVNVGDSVEQLCPSQG